MTLVKRKNNDWLPAMLDDMFQTDWLGGSAEMKRTGTNLPAVNIRENDDAFLMELAAPGNRREGFNIELDNGILTISSEEKEGSTSGEEGKFTRKEFSYRSFSRSFDLPETVDNEKISAQYENGVLKIEIPKREESKPAPKRMIDIS